jgi:hypothetical protein
VTLTTPQLVDAYRRRSGLPGRQILLLLARCALVRLVRDYWADMVAALPGR